MTAPVNTETVLRPAFPMSFAEAVGSYVGAIDKQCGSEPYLISVTRMHVMLCRIDFAEGSRHFFPLLCVGFNIYNGKRSGMNSVGIDIPKKYDVSVSQNMLWDCKLVCDCLYECTGKDYEVKFCGDDMTPVLYIEGDPMSFESRDDTWHAALDPLDFSTHFYFHRSSKPTIIEVIRTFDSMRNVL